MNDNRRKEGFALKDLVGYIILGLMLIGVAAVLYIPFYLWLRNRIPLIRQLHYLGLAGILFVIACATLLLDIVDGLRMGQLFHPPVKMVNVIPFNWRHKTWTMGSGKMITQIVANILMFVPLGFLLPVVFPKLRRCIITLACILLTSLSIEILQYYIGRSADIDDLIQNFTGGAIGYLLFYILSLVFRPTRFWQKALGSIR